MKGEIDAHASRICRMTLSEIKIYLKGKNFFTVLRDASLRRNMYFYQHASEVDGVKQNPTFVRIVSSSV